MSNINLKSLLFSFDGSINRQTFWIGISAISATLAAIQAAVFASVNASDAELVAILACVPFVLPVLAVCAKRNRDRGQSMAWLLVLAAQPAGLIWMVVDLGMRPARDEISPSVATA